VEHTGPFSKPAVHVSVTSFVTDVHLQQNNVINYRHGQSTVQTQSIKRKECSRKKETKTCLVNGLQKVVHNLPDAIQLFEMICSIEFRNEGYLSEACVGLMTTSWTAALKVVLIIIIHKRKPNIQRCIARNVFLAAIKRVLWFGLLEKNGSIAILQAENDCIRHTRTIRVEKLMFVLRWRTLSLCTAGRTGKNGGKFQSV